MIAEPPIRDARSRGPPRDSRADDDRTIGIALRDISEPPAEIFHPAGALSSAGALTVSREARPAGGRIDVDAASSRIDRRSRRSGRTARPPQWDQGRMQWVHRRRVKL